MLKTALRPRSLAFLAVALLVAALFVALSTWQLRSSLSSSTMADPAKDRVTALEGVVQPGEPTSAQQADHVVSAEGTYVPDSTVLVPGRLQDGVSGYWVVTELRIPGSRQRWDAADSDLGIAVARGWVASAEDAPRAPSGRIRVIGRLLPTDSPQPGQHLPAHQVGSVASAQLSNLWDAPLYSGYVAAFAENPADEPAPVTRDGTVAASAEPMGEGLGRLQIQQQPTDTSVHALNLFYAVEWVVFAGFAFFLWWRYVRDEHLRRQHPEQYFYFDGDYFWDEAAQSFYYWDAQDQCYYYFDDQPAVDARSHTGDPRATPRSDDGAHDD
ncbi:SURF1 family protein [Kocuria tytonis]|uniref:SURF1-like protein n=1 Tax=Kocuria tytonis TaxID=2054280 RepID=A0A495ABI1_9MICC|nr:SURF1 family protein [Kocuria tytonis]RKQ36880.1 SURF1 family protein [Kocuria tytonis]